MSCSCARSSLADERAGRGRARRARAVRAARSALLIVNDRPHVAVEAGADGVHVGQEDMPVARGAGLVGPDMLIGLSTHAPAEIDAVDAGARRLHRRGSGPRDADQARARGGGPRAGPLRGGARAACRSSRSGAWTREQRRRGARRGAPRACACCARSPTPRTPSARRASCATCSTRHPSGGEHGMSSPSGEVDRPSHGETRASAPRARMLARAPGAARRG